MKHKTRTERVYNEATGWYETREVELKGYAFTEMLRKHGLMVRIKRRRRYKTTDSEHNYRKYPNLIKDLVPTRWKMLLPSVLTAY